MKTKKGKGALILIAAVVLIAVTVLIIGASGKSDMINFKGKMTVGKDISIGDITEFYYTKSSSTNPPDFQRYKFYTENGKYYFYREIREGDTWPLTENDITESKKKELTKEDWDKFYDCINGGEVVKRTENTESGGSGPWIFLYSKKDKGKYQQFSFSTYEKQTEFEAFCKSLIKSE